MPRIPVVLALSLLAAGCRSSAPDASPKVALTPPVTAAPSVPTPDPAPPSAASLAAPPPTAAAAPAADGATASANAAAETAAGADEETAPGDPATIQKEAVELCQAALDSASRGEIERALAGADHAYELMLQLPASDPHLQSKEDIRILVADVISRVYRSARAGANHRKPAASWDLGLGLLTNDHVQREIDSFLGPERELFLDAYRRSGRYRPMILGKLAEAGLPSQLSWLPLVESAFKTRALSRASALGLWQFISSTGLRYSLSRDQWIDERLDPEKSTDAAIKYLADLHAYFGDWPKALAAYNCGEARVMRLSSGSEYLDFWDLYIQLPGETRRYVPRLFAALQILENPGKYGLSLPDSEGAQNGHARVRVEKSVALDKLDLLLGLPEGTLAEMNPELRYKATPKTPYDLRVPAGKESVVPEHMASLPEWKNPRPEYVIHRVRSGETIGTIAKHYGASVAAILTANGMRSAARLRVGQQLRIPVPAGSRPATRPSNKRRRSS
jgi:membrane-bound lytic murein transglycosylase D